MNGKTVKRAVVAVVLAVSAAVAGHELTVASSSHAKVHAPAPTGGGGAGGTREYMR